MARRTAQNRYLSRMYAERRDLETGCDCPGCEKCKGFVRNCACDHDMTWYTDRYGKGMEELETHRDGRPNMDVGAKTPDPKNEFPF